MITDMEILINVIMEDAFQETKAVLNKAEKEANFIREKSYKAQEKLKQLNKGNQSDLFLVKAKMLSQAELNARMEIIKQKEAILRDILDMMKQEFFFLANHLNYPSILRRLIVKGLEYLEGNNFICQVNEQDHNLLTPLILRELSHQTGKKISLSEYYLETKGGAIIQRNDGRVLYDNTLEAIFSRQEEKMRFVAAEYFFVKA